MSHVALVIPGLDRIGGAERQTMLLALGLLNRGWQVSIVDEKVEPLDLNQETDLVGITAMTTTVHSAYEIAAHFRRRGIKVVMGGMHVSCLPEEALPHCDSVMIGEAEVLWPALLRDFDREQLKPIYRHDEGLPPLAGLPRPDWNLYENKNIYRFILSKPPAAARLTVSSAP